MSERKGGKAILICHVFRAREIVWLSLSLSLTAISPICVPARSSIVDWAIDWREPHRSMLLTAWITVICHYRRMSLQTFLSLSLCFSFNPIPFILKLSLPLFFRVHDFFLFCANNWWLWRIDGRLAVIRRSVCQTWAVRPRGRVERSYSVSCLPVDGAATCSLCGKWCYL